MQLEPGVETTQVEGPGDGSSGAQPGARSGQFSRKGVGPVAANVDEGTARHAKRQGLAVHSSLAVEHEAALSILGRARLTRRDHGVERHVASLLVQRQPAVVNDQALYDGQPDAPPVIGSVRLQVPTASALAVDDEVDPRAGEGQRSHFDLAQKQPSQSYRDVEPFDLGGIALGRPCGPVDAETAHRRRGRPTEQPDIQVPFQSHLPAARGGGGATDRTAHPVPVEKNEEQEKGGDEGEGDRRRDELRPAGTTNGEPYRIPSDHIGAKGVAAFCYAPQGRFRFLAQAVDRRFRSRPVDQDRLR